MRVLANENIPLASVVSLRQAGHDVLSVTEFSPGISDKEVLRLAHSQARVILTFDRDYGELVFRHRLPVPAGVVYLRFSPASPIEPASYFAQLIANGIELAGKFSTGDREQVRQRPLPTDDGLS
jgi:predicted nuclease of predicted toxin-antitoxin system